MNVRPTPVWVLAAVGLTLTGAVARAEPDVLERPALISPRAIHSVLLAATRADKRLVVAGERGIILLSDDNGVSWKQAQVPVSVSLTGAHFATPRLGWAVGHSGTVLRTADGGATWTRQLDGKQAARLLLEDAERAASEGNDRRLRDAQRVSMEGPDKPFFAVHFLDERRGFIVGAFGLFFATNDGGSTWLPWHSRIDNPDAKHLYAIAARGASVYIAGEQGALYRSTDEGRSFTTVETPYRGSYFGITFLANDDVLVYGLRGTAYTLNGWRRSDTGTQSALTASHVVSDGSVVVVSQRGELLRSSDHGRTFRTFPGEQRSPYAGITATADGTLIVCGTRGVSRIITNGRQK